MSTSRIDMPDPPMRSRRVSRVAGILLSTLMTSSCATQYVEQLAQVTANSRDYHLPTAVGVDACRSSLKDATGDQEHELDAGNIRLINWNVQKKSKSSWIEDYQQLADGKDLILIQEASLREDTINDVDATKHWSFAPGYRTDGQVSGVMTLSSIKPLTQCSFVNLEPVIRTPKATSITQYALSQTDDTLVVVNVHAVNFSLGLKAFQTQFDQIAEALSDHSGPVILSGDFNTWRARRMKIVDALADRLGLEPLVFAEDHRVRVFGQTIDHIYVRGLSTLSAETSAVTTSDHNPMSVTLTL